MDTISMSTHKKSMKYAMKMSEYSLDPSTKVGCMILFKDGNASFGCNQFPEGVKPIWDRKIKYLQIVHAEINALLDGLRRKRVDDLKDAIIYITEFPCSRCCSTLLQAGLRNFVIRQPKGGFADRWKDDIESSKSMMSQVDARLIILDTFDLSNAK